MKLFVSFLVTSLFSINNLILFAQDSDGDGILDVYETNTGIYISPTNTGTDPYNLDTDQDGLNDGIEIKNSIAQWAYEDIDGDGRLDVNEDVDSDGNLDVNEDVDGDGNLDVYEDIDEDGKLDVYEQLYLNSYITLSPEEAMSYGEDTLLIIDEISHNGVFPSDFWDNPDYWHSDDDGDGNLDINEDIDGDGRLDYDEDIDLDGKLDVVNEDIDLDGNLDVNEDVDGDGLLGRALITSNTDPNVADSDGDGLSDGDEAYLHNTDFNLADSDNDGLSDGDEINLHNSNPTSIDSDWDGLIDGDEVSIYGTNPNSTDSDRDGLLDSYEVYTHFTDPNNSDSDGDGLDDSQEVTYNTDPNIADTSGDGLEDGEVVSAGFDPTVDYTNLKNVISQSVQDLRLGSTMIEVSGNQATVQLQMEESSDLQTWEDAGTPATMTIPADTDIKFFRFKMAE